MASSRGTLNGPDWRDIALALEAFEAQNNVVITVTVHTTLTNGLADLCCHAIAIEKEPADTEAAPSALAQAECLASSFRNLEGAVFQLLYAVDFQLALRELAKSYDLSA